MTLPLHPMPDVIELENAWIPLSDGVRLAARIWLPANAGKPPVPAILEYLPYRKDDVSANQDATRHPYFATQGFAAVRVDLRGTGDSDGILCDEYLRQEQDDALEVLAYLAEQPWCDGNVGMIGYSWGGFNGLQVAARRPPQLKAIVTMYAADDRYLDDCHYMGGCLLGSDMLKWAESMRLYNALPPDPRFRDDWREVWLDRLAHTPAFIEPWMSHPARDGYWKQGSVAEEYSAIQAATLVVGGWADAYTNAVPRLLERLECERRALIGPWAHVVPYRGVPGPAIDFLSECMRWFGRWLKGEDTGVEADPMLRVWMNDSYEPAPFYAEMPGRWTEQPAWPPPSACATRMELAPGGVLSWKDTETVVRAGGDRDHTPSRLDVTTAEQCGQAAGVWCMNGRDAEAPVDQRSDDDLSACFDTLPLDGPFEVLGFPVAHLALATDREAALVAVRLCEVAPDGASTLVSWGLLNLAHRDGFGEAAAVPVSEEIEVAVQLNAIGHRFSAGNRIRLAISPAYWPHAWPSPQAVTLTLALDGRCILELPVLNEPAGGLTRPFGEPEVSAPDAVSRSNRDRTRERSIEGDTYVIHDHEWSSEHFSASDTTLLNDCHDRYRITRGDPLSAETTAVRETVFKRPGWDVRVRCEATMRADAETFVVDDVLRAWEGEDLVFECEQSFRFPRGLL